MHLILVGLNHKSAPVILREKLAFQPEQTGVAVAQLIQANGCKESQIIESIILSTCNRVEIYALVTNIEAGIERIRSFLSNFHNIPLNEFQAHLYSFFDFDVVKHLFSVASGIESMVIGETQIQSQVKQAFELAQKHKSVGPVLSTLFRNALTVGKRVRNETAISTLSLSISRHALNLMEQYYSNLTKLNVLVIGVGVISEITLRLLLKRGANNVKILNRTEQYARELAKVFGIEAFGLDKLKECIKEADVIISSTSAPHIILDYDFVNGAMEQRDRPLLIIDLAVPRDVDAEVNKLENVKLFDIDDLNEKIEYNREQRIKEIKAVREILHEETAKFLSWYQSIEVKPVITELRQKVEEIREQEFERALRRFEKVLSQKDVQVVNDLSRRIINKILHQPIVRLREEAKDGNGQVYTAAVRNLFSLKESSR